MHLIEEETDPPSAIFNKLAVKNDISTTRKDSDNKKDK
jgi:hypothetical protein